MRSTLEFGPRLAHQWSIAAFHPRGWRLSRDKGDPPRSLGVLLGQPPCMKMLSGHRISRFSQFSMPARYKLGASLVRDKLPGLPADEGGGGVVHDSASLLSHSDSFGRRPAHEKRCVFFCGHLLGGFTSPCG